jgi:chaperonin cofactor prefoldin
MAKKIDLKKLDIKIKSMKKTAKELNKLADDFPALARNTARILATIKMLELNISDLVETGLGE